jgi:glycolate oxidase iron-sulfur subunit
MVNLKESDWCCGSAGIYNITNQGMASELLERKMNNIIATGSNVVATGNPGCMMQIALGAQQRGYELEVVHPIQLLDESYRAKGIYEVPHRDLAATRKRGRSLAIGIGIGILIGFLLARRRQTRD